MQRKHEQIVQMIYEQVVNIISETNGLNLADTIELLQHSPAVQENPMVEKSVNEFQFIMPLPFGLQIFLDE